MIYTLLNICFQLCSTWSVFYSQLILLKQIFQKNGYPENFIDICLKPFLNRFHILKEMVPTVVKMPLQLVLPYLGTISLQTRTELSKSIIGVLNIVNYKIFLKVKKNYLIIFASKSLFYIFLHQMWFTSFSVSHAMNPIAENVLDKLL